MQELPKIVQDRLKEDRLREDGVAEAHPEADLLTAFVEHTLAYSERARVLEHLDRCTDCREIVTLALPATETVAITTSSGRVRNRWFNWPVLRWGVVAAGIIALASIGMVQHRQRSFKSERKSEALARTLTARNETVATAQRFQPSPGSVEGQAVLPQITGRQVQVLKKASPNPQNKLSVGKSVGSMSAVPKSFPMNGGALGGAVGNVAGSGFAPAKGVTASSAARTSPPRNGPQFAVPPSSQMVQVQTADAATVATAQSGISDQLIQNQQNQKELRSQNRPVTNSDVVKAKAPTSLEASVGGASAQTLEPSIISSLQTSSAMVSASPNWTISSSGVLQRSFDAGNTWEDVNVNSVAEASASKGNLVGADEKAKTNDKKVRKEIAQPSMVFRAVTALGSEVWAGGSGAILYHSTDSGAHWVRVLPSSASTVLTGDIMVIEFSDPQHGRIATSYGKVWTTADNGQTWSLQP